MSISRNRKSGGALLHSESTLCETLFRRKGSDDCFKARIASQRIPERIETQMAISNMAPRLPRCFAQPFDCVILIARPGINDGQVLDQHQALERIFADR